MTTLPRERSLSTHAFFAGLSPDVIGFLARGASEQQIEPGEVLFCQGESARYFYLIRDGRIAIEISAITGPTLRVQSLGADPILGGSWLIPPYPWKSQARAEAPTTLLAFEGEAVRAHCEAEPNVGYPLLKRFAALMAERLEVARHKLMDQWNPPGFA